MTSEARLDDGYKGKHSLDLDLVVPYRSALTLAKKRVALWTLVSMMGAGLAGAAGYGGQRVHAEGYGVKPAITVGYEAASRSSARTPLDAVEPGGPSIKASSEGTWSLSDDAEEMGANLEAAAGKWDAAAASREKLRAKIEEAKKQDGSKWTADSWTALQTALDAAVKQVAVDPNDGAPGDYDKAADSLQAAVDGLQEKPKPASGSSSGGTGGSPGSSLGVTVPVGEMQQWFHDYLLANGYTEADFSAGVWIIDHESGWRVNATNPGSGAYGLPQALPGSKMASEGADWQTNYQTQLKWFVSYCNRYGGIQGAYQFWQQNHWY